MNGGQGDGGANGVQYDEIPYGDVGPGPSGKGQLPEVPVEYSQVPVRVVGPRPDWLALCSASLDLGTVRRASKAESTEDRDVWS